MTRLRFEYWQEGPVYWARYVTDGAPPVHEHWPGLADADALEALDGALWERFAVDNNNREEVAVYLRLVWTLLAGREVLGNACYWTGDAARWLGQAGAVARWQFETDAEGPPEYLAARGFTSARSAVQIHPPPTEHQRWMRDKTLLFRIRDFGELSILLRSVLGDAAGEISLFGTTEAGAQRVVGVLRAEEPPAMARILAGDDLFVDLGIGVDPGCNDYVLLASRSPLAPLVEPAVQELERAIQQYERTVSRFTSPSEALRLIATLAGQ